ncbi:hypothetical protein MHBO_004836 [Bonamia ostreae]|uniref:Calponin-homology (CH) domain-containing protein n=1 Tax=Bonamia ostreae TaxID=126728 RepID=A0ABV2AV63_9EUKA
MFEYFEISKKRAKTNRIFIKWINSQIKDHGIKITSLKRFIQTKAMMALVDSQRKGCYPFENISLTKESFDDCLNFAEKEFGVPKFVDYDFLWKTNDHSVLMIYLNNFLSCKNDSDENSQSRNLTRKDKLVDESNNKKRKDDKKKRRTAIRQKRKRF